MANKIIVKSFLWTALESYSSQGIAFIVSIFMARILTPADYGIIGIIGVFLALSDIFIDSGFSNALINKQNCTKADFSTVFYTNIVISLVFFAILFFCAPLIASFYKNPVLVWTTRAMALTFVISSFGAVSMTILTKELRFKAKAIIAFIVSCISGFIGIYLAYNGWGVWALVWQAVISCAARTIISIIYAKWKPALIFNKESFKGLFKFGSNLLGSNILFTLYNNIYTLVIGKVFNPKELGYFSRAEGYSKLIPNNIGGIFGKILFPILTRHQNNDKILIKLHTQISVSSSFYIFPACTMLAGVASPIVYLLISEKWMPIVALLQILSFSGMVDHFATINSNFILAKGSSKLFLQNHLITKPIGILILIISVLCNLEIVAIGKVLYTVVCVYVSFRALKKVLAINMYNFIRPIIKLFVISLLIGGIALVEAENISYTWLGTLFIISSNLAIYIVLTKLFCKDIAIKLKKK